MKHRWLSTWIAISCLLWNCSYATPDRPVQKALPAVDAPRADMAQKDGDPGTPAPDKPVRLADRPGKPAAAAPGKEDASGDCVIEPDDDDNEGMSSADKGFALNRALNLCRVSQLYWQRGDLERAIDTLDEAYSLILDVDPENDLKLLQEKEDLRFTISKRILEIYSSRQVVVNGQRNSIPITINRHVQDEITSFTTGRERDFFLEAYRRSGKYRPMIEAALKEAGMPTELSWLPLIESGFKATALSPARALGLWQFIPSTGFRYGLNRDKYIDERLNPEKATRGAIDYLRDLHAMFGDWTTVLAAYNCGEHRVLRTIQSQNINYLDNFWDLYERLPQETARYVPRFLATLHIVSAPEKYGLDPASVAPPLAFETVAVDKQAQINSIAQVTGIDDDLLRELNAELRQGILPEDGYELRVPPGSAGIVTAKAEEIPLFRPQRVRTARSGGSVSVAYYTVRRGETLGGIAQRFGTTAKSIMLANNIRKPTSLAAGKKLRIPRAECPPEEPAPARATRTVVAKRGSVEHEVRRGDSLWNIARRYGTTVQEIQRLNKVDPSSLTVGQVLKIDTGQTPDKGGAEKPRRSRGYEVRSGDNPSSIAQRHNMSVDRLLLINHLSPDSVIQPGQKLIVD